VDKLDPPTYLKTYGDPPKKKKDEKVGTRITTRRKGEGYV